jgi:heme ABC exporter ATP-binding subunit CcmA
MTAQGTAILARRLSKEFGNRWVLRAIDLDVAAGESLALTGANGSGKTTLLRCLASLVRPTEGEVRWFGRPATGDPAVRRLVGMVAHESRLYPHLSLRENLIFAARMCGVRRAAVRADALLERVGLTPRAGSLPRQVSQGMRQRVAVARALVHEPRILLLDEPFSGLDAAGREWLTELMTKQRGAGTTICFTTHDETKAVQLADRWFELRAGRLHELPVSRETKGTGAREWARAA